MSTHGCFVFLFPIYPIAATDDGVQEPAEPAAPADDYYHYYPSGYYYYEEPSDDQE